MWINVILLNNFDTVFFQTPIFFCIVECCKLYEMKLVLHVMSAVWTSADSAPQRRALKNSADLIESAVAVWCQGSDFNLYALFVFLSPDCGKSQWRHRTSSQIENNQDYYYKSFVFSFFLLCTCFPCPHQHTLILEVPQKQLSIYSSKPWTWMVIFSV